MNADETVTPRPEWNVGGGDWDVPYRFDRDVEQYVTMHDHARLVIFCTRLPDRKLLRFRRGDFSHTEEQP